MQLVLRFLIGGTFVSVFAVIGDSFKPKSFSGLFAAAPSVALTSLILVFLYNGSQAAVAQVPSMVCGSLATVAYSLSCGRLVRSTRMPAWLSAGLLWLEWGIVAFALYRICLR